MDEKNGTGLRVYFLKQAESCASIPGIAQTLNNFSTSRSLWALVGIWSIVEVVSPLVFTNQRNYVSFSLCVLFTIFSFFSLVINLLLNLI